MAEYILARDIIKKINAGDKVSAKVVEAENEDGYIELSLKEARQAMVRNEAETMMKKKTPYSTSNQRSQQRRFDCGMARSFRDFYRPRNLKPSITPEFKMVIKTKFTMN